MSLVHYLLALFIPFLPLEDQSHVTFLVSHPSCSVLLKALRSLLWISNQCQVALILHYSLIIVNTISTNYFLSIAGWVV